MVALEISALATARYSIPTISSSGNPKPCTITNFSCRCCHTSGQTVSERTQSSDMQPTIQHLLQTKMHAHVPSSSRLSTVQPLARSDILLLVLDDQRALSPVHPRLRVDIRCKRRRVTAVTGNRHPSQRIRHIIRVIHLANRGHTVHDIGRSLC